MNSNILNKQKVDCPPPEFFPPRLTAPPNILTCPGIWWHLNTINCHTDDKPIKKSFTPTKNLIRRSLPPGEYNRWEVSRALLGVPAIQLQGAKVQTCFQYLKSQGVTKQM